MSDGGPWPFPEGWRSWSDTQRHEWAYVSDPAEAVSSAEREWRKNAVREWENERSRPRYGDVTEVVQATIVEPMALDPSWPPRCPKEHDDRHWKQGCVACQATIAYAQRMGRQLDASRAAGADEGDDWAPQSLTNTEEVPPPTMLWTGERFLLREGQITLFHGLFGTGKTPVLYLAVVEQVRAGNLALIIDYEMHGPGAKQLLLELGLEEAEIEENVLYVDSPGPMTAKGLHRLLAEVRERGRRLTYVAIDSLTESMATIPGMSDNDAQDVNIWFNSLPNLLVREFGAAVGIIDHSGVIDGSRPSGSHKKRDAVQAHYWVRRDVEFSRQHDRGRSELVVMKDRSGDSVIGSTVAVLKTRLGESFYLEPPQRLVKGSDSVTLALDMQPDHSTDADVLADLQALGTKGTGRTDVTGSGARGRWRAAALDRLIANGSVIERKEGRFQWNWATEFAPS